MRKLPIIAPACILVSLLFVVLYYQNDVLTGVVDVSDSNKSSNNDSLENRDSLDDKYDSNYDHEDFVLDYRVLGDFERIDTPYVSEAKLPDNTWPLGIMVDDEGNVWVGGTKSHQLLEYDSKLLAITNTILLNDKNSATNSTQDPEAIWSIVEDNDLIWISQTGKNRLWMFDKNSHDLQIQKDVTSAAVQMQIDKDSGDLWFTDTDQDVLGVIQKTDDGTYRTHEFNLGQDSSPFGLYLSDDGNVWITESSNHKILSFTKSTSNGLILNVTKDFELAHSDDTIFYYPSDLVVLDNKIWFTEHLTNYFLEYDVDTEKLIRYPTSINPRHYGTLPFWMVEDPEQKGFWFTEHFGNRMAFFDVQNKTLTEYEIPSRDPAWNYISNAIGMAIDPNNPDHLWFSEFYLDKIGMVDRSIPVPFDISFSSDNIIVNKNDITVVVDFTVRINHDGTPIRNNEIFLKKSSSIVATAGFGNVTAKIEPDHFVVSGLESFEGKLILDEIQNMESGNYTIAISATDGTVTKTDYALLNVH